ncbi:hypothetical protein OEA41_008577 [Lepraria neglecta]|uniref:Uncharacterized protein n=1 Tax=Lepraria neglecta TaxID=209136 RepID=A0AAD9ZG22_9LECA|nr:hypothetical protein OEA41_008577 [Lepraria neglecta]
MGRKVKPQEERRATRRATQRNYNRDNTTRRTGPSNITAEPAPFNQGPESPPGRPRHPSPPNSSLLRQNPTASEPAALFDPTAEDDNHPRINRVTRKRPAASSPRSSHSRPKAPSTSSTANNVPLSTGTDTRSQSIDLSSRSNSLNRIIEQDISHTPNISQGPGVNNNKNTLYPIPQLQPRSSTSASLPVASLTSRVTAVHIPLSTSTLTSVNIPSHSTFSRPTVVTYTLLLDDDDDDDDDDDYAPDHDDPLESRSAVSGPSDLDRYDESAVSLEDDLSELSLSDEAPDPIAAAQDCLDRSWAPLCTCSKTATSTAS